MDSQVNLSHLSEEECQQILSVIQRDFSLRQQEKDRLEELKAEIKEEKLRSEILSKGRTFNENCCVRCFAQFYMLFNPKVQCTACKFNVCKKCSVYNSKQKEYMCSMCKKQEELDTLSNSWFYSNVAEKFDRFGSADVVRSIHKRKTESDIDSDSGYHPPVSSTFEQNGRHQTAAQLIKPTVEEPPTTGIDKEESVFALLRERLDVIEQSVTKLHLHENRTEQQKQFYDNSVKQNIDNVQTLLMTVSKQLASNVNSADSDGSSSERVNREQQETIAKQLLRNAMQQLYSSQPQMFSVNDEDPFAFIDPAGLTLDAYTKRLSEAIINKINEDHHQSQRQIKDEVEEEEVEEEEVVDKRMPGLNLQHSDSELVTTDSMSDVDVRDRVSLWQQKSMDTDLSRSESQSMTSLNQSQSGMEIPPSFIESEILTETLAALNQSEMLNVSSQSSTDTQANPVVSNQSDLDRHLTSVSSESDAETRTSVTIIESKVETPEAVPEAVTPCAEQLEDDLVVNTYVSDKKFDSADYEVTTDSILAFAMRKRETPVLPSIDSNEGDIAIKSTDSDLDLTKDHTADKSYGPWTLGINRRIPMTPHDSFRSKHLSDRSRNESPLIFLPRHLQIESPFIGDINASELSDTDSLSVSGGESDADDVKPSETIMQTDDTTPVKHQRRTMSQTDDGRNKPKSSVDCFAQTDEDLQPEEKSTRTDEGSRADSAIDSSSFDFPDSIQDLEPRFIETPQNVVVCCGQSFKCKATLNGRKPIDVYWFHDTFRLDFDERCTVAHKGQVFSMEVVESTLADDGHYVCLAFNEHGRCCHQFTVSVIDPENFEKAGGRKGFKVLTMGKREKPNPTPVSLSKEQSQTATSIPASTVAISANAVSPDASSHCVTSTTTIPLSTMSHDNISKCDLSSETSTAVVSKPSEMIPEDAVSSHVMSDKSRDGLSPADDLPHEVQMKVNAPACSPESLQSVPTPVARSRLTRPRLENTSDSADTRRDDQQTLPVQNQPPLQVPREKESLHLAEASASSKPHQLGCLTEEWLQQSDCEDATPSDGKVELVLSFPEFDRLYKARIMTPDRLRSGRFTPAEVELIQKILSTHQETEENTLSDNQQLDSEKQTEFDFSYKEPGLKAQFYGRDYLIKDSGELPAGKQSRKTKPSHQVVAASSVLLSRPHNTDDAVECHHATNSDVVRKNVAHGESSARRHHPESSSTKDHRHQPSSESLATHPPPSDAEDNPDENRLEEDAATAKTATELEELNLPSVRNLRLLFNAPAASDESAFTRNYSLTARDLPNSVIAQQHAAKKTRKPRLSLVPEPSNEI